jgi:para-aminobenzoate synthetase / 4-amino-4-deoxychorismate lyase
MFNTDTPFVLFDDARVSGASPARLYRTPIRTLEARHLSDLPALFATMRESQEQGLHIAGYIGYEAGYALAMGEAVLSNSPDSLLAWFGIFSTYQLLDSDAIAAALPSAAGAYLTPILPDISRQEYGDAFKAAQDYITAGDIYQANLTFRASAHYAGDPLALYAALRPQAGAGYGGVVWTGERWLLSFSPELFFALKDGRVTTKPMKGTALRDVDPMRDAALVAELKADPKQRAENLMIVDLLRNDLSRVCEAGTVSVPDLFRIESYPTVHQMTSTVTGTLQDGKQAVDLIEALFPCGSITGAPKIRAMQIIDEIEPSPRGAYCGSIGRIDVDGDAAFNVAIRTFSLCEKQKRVSLGLGSGLVADSVEADEWAECLAKGNFAKMPGRSFDLIETMRFEPAKGILRLELHLERMKESARALDFAFDRHAARNQLHAVTFHLDAASKIRLMLGRQGTIAIEVATLPVAPEAAALVKIVPLPVDVGDFRLRHKTTDRAFYDAARLAEPGAFEVIFITNDGYLTEGSFTALFVERDGRYLTPPLSRGLLPSVLRRELIAADQAQEANLVPADLVDGFWLGNSVRGLFRAQLCA